MITTRERLSIPELVRGIASAPRAELDGLVRKIVPAETRQLVYASQGKAAFEQIVIAAKLERSRILMPAFFPDDFVGIFLKYQISPVFVDVDPRTYHLDLNAIRPDQLDGVRALLIEHTFGLPAEGAAYREFCDRRGLILIEDCARALGAARQGQLVGSFGHYSMFSLPKCAPVRAGGLALAEAPFRPALAKPKIGVSGLLHALTLVKFPCPSIVERAAYAALADSSIYPREVGNYDPLPAREFDGVGKFMLKTFLPYYADALEKKRECAAVLRSALEPRGFTFQADPDGEHIYTSVAAEPPAGCNADELKGFLIRHGVKASAMWRHAIGVSEFGGKTWHARPESTPVARHLAERLIQLPVSRFRTPAESRKIIELCDQFAGPAAATAGRQVRFAS